MASTYDAIVIGCGAAGAGAAWGLSRERQKTLVLDQYGPNHRFGSTHGESRIFRTAYHEGSIYVPLSRRSQELWKSLPSPTGARIIDETGGLYLGRRRDPLIQGALASAKQFSLPHTLLTADEVRARFPPFHPREEDVGFWDPAAGYIVPEAAIDAMASRAMDAGATFGFNDVVKSWKVADDAVSVESSSGRHGARALVLACGPWTPQMIPELSHALTLERQVVYWHRTKERSPDFTPTRMPVFLWQISANRSFYYGIPDLGGGVKVASDTGRRIGSPDEAVVPPVEDEYRPVREFVVDRLPGLDTSAPRAEPCVYTNSPDHHFLIGRHPSWRNVIIVSACSGHGFKFAPAVGELAAKLVRDESTAQLPAEFDPARFFPG